MNSSKSIIIIYKLKEGTNEPELSLKENILGAMSNLSSSYPHTSYEIKVIPKDNLPPTGLIVEKNGTSIVSGYIYITNSTGALLEWIVSNPEYRDKDRKKL